MVVALPARAKQVRRVRRALQARRLQASRQWTEKEQIQALRKVVQRAMSLPMYRDLWKGQARLIRQADTLQTLLAALPIIDKPKAFGDHRLDELLPSKRMRQVGLVYSSSGFSGRFAWGVEAREARDDLGMGLDVLLDLLFDVASKPALIINALPTGVRIEAELPVVIETGPRADSVVAALRTLRPCFGQTIVVGDWALLKEAIEQATQQRVLSARGGPMHLITGGDWIAENWRSYVMGLLARVHPKLAGQCVINFGVSELGLSVGLETKACKLTRQAAHADPKLAEKLFGVSRGVVVPTLVQYQPWDYVIETTEVDGQERLVVTTLQKDRLLPLVRYTTGDRARVWSYEQWCGALEHAGRPDLKPKEGLPMLAIGGRGLRGVPSLPSISPLGVREAIFSVSGLAERVTGHFVVEQVGQRRQLTMQLKPGAKVPALAVQLFQKQLQRTLNQTMPVRLIDYHDYRPGMSLNYLRKFDHEL